MRHAARPRAGFRPDIEGLRAIAIGTVVLYHAYAPLMPGGFIGVDVFFVISGYLISQVILKELDTDRFSYARFYTRRIRRIFPALFFLLAVTSLLTLIALAPDELAEYGKTVRATALFLSNWQFYHLSGYFNGSAELKPLLHTWSLAVEEQFYIVFPFMLVLTKRWLRGRYFTVISICAAASLVLSIVLTAFRPNAAFYFGPSRAFELMIGAMIAASPPPRALSGFVREGVAGAGLAAIIVSAIFLTSTTPFPGAVALLPCVGAGAIIYCGAAGPSSVARLLSLAPVRFIGAISYSLYLWHWPMLSLARHFTLGEMTAFSTCAALAAAFAFAVISWRYVEQPFRTRERREKPLFGAASLAIFAGVAVGTILVAADGLPQRFSPEAVRLFATARDFSAARARCHSYDQHEVAIERSCVFGDATAAPSIAVWGDSHGVELADALGGTIGPGKSLIEITASSCPPALGVDPPKSIDCSKRNDQTLRWLAKNGHIRSIVLIASYSEYDGGVYAGIDALVDRLVHAGKTVLLVYPTPFFPTDVPVALAMRKWWGLPASSYVLPRSRFDQQLAPIVPQLDRIVSRYGAVPIPAARAFCDAEACSPYDGRNVLFFDNAHPSMTGARRIAAQVAARL